jgi:hypothetical protein
MTAVGAGYAKVWANSGRTANTLIMAPDRFGYILGHDVGCVRAVHDRVRFGCRAAEHHRVVVA